MRGRRRRERGGTKCLSQERLRRGRYRRWVIVEDEKGKKVRKNWGKTKYDLLSLSGIVVFFRLGDISWFIGLFKKIFGKLV